MDSMQKGFLAAVMVIAAVSLCSGARAGTFDFGFTGPGVSGSIDLTYGAGRAWPFPASCPPKGMTWNEPRAAA
jgi:hypothetical protein